MESYFNDCNKLMKDTGVDLYCSEKVLFYFPNTSPTGKKLKRKESGSLGFTCKVCYDEFTDSVKDGFSLGCDHTFCKDCFREYLKSQVNDGPLCVQAHCLEHKCHQAVTKDVYYAFLQGEMREKYDRYVSKHFIEFSKSMRFCPAPNCEKVIVCSSDGSTTVDCSCGHVMCFRCGDEAHEPSSCVQLQAWTEKSASDGESAKWIFANTKKCPKCFTRIEKNQGCMYMSCSNCHHSFCWMCMGTHHVYVCDQFKPTHDETVEMDAAQRVQAELDRYLHYYKR